jgi:selenoprotein W-related protein
VKPVLIEGSGGVFDVVVDGKLVFSKKKTKRFPEKEEVFGLLGGAHS